MSKSRNIKRARALRQKKALKHYCNKPLKHENIIFPLTEAGLTDEILVFDRALIGSKYKVSELVIEMIYPMLITANSLKEIREIYSLGVVAWNCGIIWETSGEAGLLKVLRMFKNGESFYERKLLDEYINVKCTKYKAHKEFIINYELTLGNDSSKFTVTTILTEREIEDFLNEN
jgi:hypothetical protein